MTASGLQVPCAVSMFLFLRTMRCEAPSYTDGIVKSEGCLRYDGALGGQPALLKSKTNLSDTAVAGFRIIFQDLL